jgi:predicted nucleotidyltransferase
MVQFCERLGTAGRNPETIHLVAERHGGTPVRVFGPLARGDNTSSSDLDLLIERKPGYSLLDVVAIKRDLEDLSDDWSTWSRNDR